MIVIPSTHDTIKNITIGIYYTWHSYRPRSNSYTKYTTLKEDYNWHTWHCHRPKSKKKKKNKNESNTNTQNTKRI